MINSNLTRAKAKRHKKTKVIKDLSDSEADSDAEISLKNLPIPVDTEGFWVKRENFFGKKSFGFFVCKNCKKTWLSAHSHSIYKQGCKGCETENYAKYFWVNSHKKEKDPDFQGLNKEKPHDKMRCEACHLGICLDRLKI